MKFNENKFRSFIEELVDSIDEETIFEIAKIDLKDRKEIMTIYFDNFFTLTEGSSCSHDKANYVVRKIEKSIETNENLKLPETYGEYQSRGGNIGSITELDEICYWCPKTIPDTQTALKLFDSYIRMDMKTYKQIVDSLTSK